MHPRNLYNKKPDFGELAAVRPTLRPYLISKSKQSTKRDSDQQQPIYQDHVTAEVSPSHPNLPTSNSPSSLDQEREHKQHSVVASEPSISSTSTTVEGDLTEQQSERKFAYTLDFSDPAALRELTCAVLEKDFGLKVEIPLDKLIPAVPQRLNYVHWIEDLLMCCGDSVQNRGEGGASKSADPAVGEVGVALDHADSAISGEPLLQTEVERTAAPSDCADSTVCGEAEKGVACYQKEGVASDHADVTVPKGDSILGVDIGTSLDNNCLIIASLWVHPLCLKHLRALSPSSSLVFYYHLYSHLVIGTDKLTTLVIQLQYWCLSCYGFSVQWHAILFPSSRLAI